MTSKDQQLQVRKQTEQHKNRRSEALKRYYSNPENRAKHSRTMMGHAPSFTRKGEEHPQYRHGRGSTRLRDPLYLTWSRMKRRCQNKNSKDYSRYGGKGVVVCERWQSFINFYEDMSSIYKVGLSIERTDNSKGYSPDNCRWATLLEQARNKRSVRTYLWEGQKLTIPELAVVMGLKHDTLYRKLQRVNWTLVDLLTETR